MHCTACDRLLTEYESTRRNANTFQFIDLCKVCFEDVKPFVPTIDRADLITEQDLDEDPDNDDMDTMPSLEDDDALYSYVDTMKFSSEDYDV
jgi:hypothetical protein